VLIQSGQSLCGKVLATAATDDFPEQDSVCPSKVALFLYVFARGDVPCSGKNGFES
jgi:hypothetical protein